MKKSRWNDNLQEWIETSFYTKDEVDAKIKALEDLIEELKG